MNFINKQVTHKQFGKGKVVDISDSCIEIRFTSGDKRFVFPDACGTYLTLIDQRAADLVKRMNQERKEIYKKEEMEREKERALRYEEQQRLLQREKIMKNSKFHPSSQAAFWCQEEEQDEVFTEWRVFTGITKSGNNQGQIRRPSRLYPNSACLFTAKDSSMPEKDRYILGVYMVNEDFIGTLCEDGYISAHPEYRLRLSREESGKILFWNYYANEKYLNRMTWNSGRCRYLDNVWMAQILRDIASLKKETSEQEFAQKFFEHFCEMNGIKKNELPQPNGVLMRIQA